MTRMARETRQSYGKVQLCRDLAPPPPLPARWRTFLVCFRLCPTLKVLLASQYLNAGYLN